MRLFLLEYSLHQWKLREKFATTGIEEKRGWNQIFGEKKKDWGRTAEEAWNPRVARREGRRREIESISGWNKSEKRMTQRQSGPLVVYFWICREVLKSVPWKTISISSANLEQAAAGSLTILFALLAPATTRVVSKQWIVFLHIFWLCLTSDAFQLRFTAKQLLMQSRRAEKQAKKEKVKLKRVRSALSLSTFPLNSVLLQLAYI